MSGMELFVLFFIPGSVLVVGFFWLWVAYKSNKNRF